MKAIIITLIMLLTFLGSPSTAFAHLLETNYLIPTQTKLEIQAVFSSGEPLPLAPVKVFAPNDPSKPWMEGTTDEQGKFAVVIDKSIEGEWEVEIGDLENSEHGDILTIPVGKSGIEGNEISQRLPQKENKGIKQIAILGFATIAGVFGRKLIKN